MSKERRLGRGLEALLGRAGIDPATPTPVTDGSAAVASQPAARPASGLGSGAARLILHAAEEVEEAAVTLAEVSRRGGDGDGEAFTPPADMKDDDNPAFFSFFSFCTARKCR